MKETTILKTVLLPALALLLLGFAPARKPESNGYPPAGDCHDDRLVDRCSAEQQRRVRELFGVGTIEAHRDAGDQVRRAFYVDGYGRDVVAIVFIRPKGGDPALSVHFPREENGRRPEPLRVPVPAAAWQEAIERSAHFDRALPGRVHRVVHEKLVDEPEAEIRRLLGHLGLPFDPACLRFHENDRAVRTASSEQVRRPINREGMDQWRPYAAWLGPLEEALGDVLPAYPDVPAEWQ